MKIMLIDDDPSLQLALKHIICDEGYEFCCASDGRCGLEMLGKERPDLLLLDVMLPKMNGYDVCREMRAQGRRIPVIFLSSKGDIIDKGIGFKAGGDDYVVKPFDNEELLMRIAAHLGRHKSDLAFARANALAGTSAIGDLEIDFSGYEVRKRGEKLDLTGKEFEILALLASNPGRAFSREQIYEHIWGEGSVVDTNSITVFTRRIREKIEDKASQPVYLLTVWGVGYKFANRIDA
jgi:DNA-binding response OmpR family regulator